MEKIAISVEEVCKIYKLYGKPSERFKEALGISKKTKYKEHYALNKVSFKVNCGETVGIIGTNGSGKSTILKIITGVLNPTFGNVYINGRISALLELGAGFNMEYTGIENIYLNGTMIGFSKEEIDSKLEDIIEFADIGDFINQPVKTYSSGMFVRLAFAVAINIDPEILIVDEALSVGDVFFQAKCYKKFEEFKKMGKTVLFVSHDLSSISKYCDRVILLNQGNKLAEGNSKEMVDLYKKVLVNQLENKTEKLESERKKVARNNKQAWKDNLSINPGLSDYGNHKANIIDFGIMTDEECYGNTVIKGEEFSIKIKIRCNENISEPILAFTIRDKKGTEITGTNTMYEKIFLGDLKPGDEKAVSFTQKMSLQGGEYLLSLGCTGYINEEFVVYHRLYDVCSIIVVSEQDTVGVFDMGSSTQLI